MFAMQKPFFPSGHLAVHKRRHTGGTDARSIIIMIIQSIALIKSANESLMLYLVHAPLLICYRQSALDQNSDRSGRGSGDNLFTFIALEVVPLLRQPLYS
jgi:hypothetical protein